MILRETNMPGYGNNVRRMLPLSLVSEGECVELLDIREQGAVRQRLADMGLTPGTTLRVVRADSAGAMIVAIRQDARLAVGHSTARKIMVCMPDER